MGGDGDGAASGEDDGRDGGSGGGEEAERRAEGRHLVFFLLVLKKGMDLFLERRVIKPSFGLFFKERSEGSWILRSKEMNVKDCLLKSYSE